MRIERIFYTIYIYYQGLVITLSPVACPIRLDYNHHNFSTTVSWLKYPAN
jgi:hypothetical protein